MKKSNQLILSVAMITGLAAMSGLLPAVAKGDSEHNHQQKIERLSDRLDLTEQQSAQVKQLFIESRASNKRPSKEMKKQRRQQHQADLKAFFDAPNFDQQAVINKLAQRQAKHQQKMIAKMELKHAIYQLLTTQQQEKYLKMLSHKMRHDSKHRGDKRHSRSH